MKYFSEFIHEVLLRYFADKNLSIFFSKGHNSGKGHNPDG